MREHEAPIAALMDDIDAVVYVADMESYDLLYMNETARRVSSGSRGDKCWQTLQQGQTGPCAFCTNDRLLDDQGMPVPPLVWEHQNTNTGEWYECRDHAFRWPDGRLVRLEVATNITERKNAELAATRSEQNAQQYLDLAGVMFVALDRNGTTTMVNRKACETLGYQEDEIVGANWFDLVIPERLKAEIIPVSKQLLAGEIAPAEYYENPVVTKSGEERLIAWHNTILRDADGNIVGHLSSGADITQQKLQELILASRLHLSELSVNHSVIDVLRAVLDEAERLTGSSIGFFHFVEPDQLTLSLQVWSTNTLKTMCTAEGSGTHRPLSEAGVWVDCLREGKPVIHNDYAGLSHRKGLPEGHAPVIREVVVPLYREGEAVAVIGVGNKPLDYGEQDIEVVRQLADAAWEIVVRMQTEQKLTESELIMIDALQSVSDGIWSWNIQSGENTFDERSAEMFGFETGAAVLDADVVFSRIHPDDLPGVMRALDDHAAGKTAAYDHRFRLLLPENQIRWVRGRGKAIEHDGEGKALRMIGTNMDITESVRMQLKQEALEKQMLHSQKLESLGILAGGIAHDFNNILTVILGHSDLAEMDLADESPVRENLKQIKVAARKAADLANQMLAYSGKGKFLVEPLDLSATIRDMTNMLTVSVSKKAVLQYQFSEDTPTVEADATQLRQVIMNLVINASEAIEDQSGVISVSTGIMECDQEYLVEISSDESLSPGSYAFVEVSDTGCGMTRETAGRVF
ncbi:MAG: GAF domain-containing protein, partial [Spirochaetales bacterium]|nr:GAF domain-containing protein [Spirochaetales bacterium]